MESQLAVREVLTNDYVGVSESDTVADAAELMRAEQTSCVLVVRGSEPVGIMTEWDVLGVVTDGREPTDLTVGAVMSTPVMTIDADRSLADAITKMNREKVRTQVVEDQGELLGVLTQRDVIAAAGSLLSGPTPPQSTGTEAVTNGGESFGSQGICERCGSLADTLWNSNGQLVCPDCRAV